MSEVPPESRKDAYWRVFYTTPRAEKKCETRLEERGVAVFLPKRAIMRQWKDRKKKVIEPLFPNYLFACVDEHERLRVLQTPGIVRCVSFAGTLAKMTEAEIEQLRITQNAPGQLEPLEGPLPKRGATVVVEEGPLKGLKGEVSEHRNGTHLIVIIPTIRQAIRVNLPAVWAREEPPSR